MAKEFFCRGDSAWQVQLREAVRDPAELLRQLELPSALLDAQVAASPLQFPLLVPQAYIRRMRLRDPNDPLLRQVLPLNKEYLFQPGYSSDPVGEMPARQLPGLLHKYHGRVLLVLNGVCAVHCRYCFRREYPYVSLTARQQEEIISYISGDKTVHEVILSGGDPLVLSDAKLQTWLDRLENISHISTLRIHSRLPVVLPARITQDLLDCLGGSRLRTLMVIHANHANEFDRDTEKALALLRNAGIWLFNQSVLLRGVNDSVESLVALSQALGRNQVQAYYLHLLDKVQGAAHFDVSKNQALHLMDALRTQIPGYLVPQLVHEVAGMGSKVPVCR